MIRVGLFWILLTGTYLALVGAFTVAEGIAALVCGGLGALWTWQLARCGDHHIRVRIAALGPLISAFAMLPGETVRVGVRLARAAWAGDVAGADRAVPPCEAADCPLRGDDPKVAAARAVAVLAASLSPDSYVLRLEPERGRILVHALLPARQGRIR